jgi:type VI secretion system protein VasD
MTMTVTNATVPFVTVPLVTKCLVAVAFGIGSLVSGCGLVGRTAGCRSPRAMEVTLTVSERLNPDDQGRSLPTVVRVYQLRGLSRLENAEFEDVWQRDRETLGDELVQVEELTVFPNDRVVRPLEVAEGVGAVVAVALVRKPQGTSWRAVVELPTEPCPEGHATHRLVARLALDGYRIERLGADAEEARR